LGCRIRPIDARSFKGAIISREQAAELLGQMGLKIG
jgi:hypothetical protein